MKSSYDRECSSHRAQTTPPPPPFLYRTEVGRGARPPPPPMAMLSITTGSLVLKFPNAYTTLEGCGGWGVPSSHPCINWTHAPTPSIYCTTPSTHKRCHDLSVTWPHRGRHRAPYMHAGPALRISIAIYKPISPTPGVNQQLPPRPRCHRRLRMACWPGGVHRVPDRHVHVRCHDGSPWT